jgi:NAD(P)-dependent dehydrogenase (short-subunit alcohol dehydrogenase family)
LSLDEFNLINRHIIVTGAAGLLGREFCEAIAQNKGIPIMLDTNKNKLISIHESILIKYGINSIYFDCDITNELQLIKVNKLLETKNIQIRGIVNNAAINNSPQDITENSNRLEDYKIEQWKKEIDVGLTGAFIVIKIFARNMLNHGKSCSIVNISSDLGLIAPDHRIYNLENAELQFFKPVAYSVIKHGIIGLTKYISTYWLGKNIRCNTLSPSAVFSNQSEKFINKLIKLIPMNRMSEKTEFNSALIFLLSDASSYMTGSNLILDGGRSTW